MGAVAFWAAADLGPAVLWAGALVAGVSVMAWHAVAWLALITDVEAGSVGSASGVVHLGSSIGFGIGPLVFGLIADHASYGWAWATTASLFAAATAATLVWRAAVGGSPGARRGTAAPAVVP